MTRPNGGSSPEKDAKDRMALSRLYITFVLTACCAAASASPDGAISGIRAHLMPASYHVPVGQPVWVLFAIENTTDEPITLTVPGTEPQIPSPEAGLPLSHVFSGGGSPGVVVTTESKRKWESPMGYHSSGEAPILIVAPRSTVGTSLDLRGYYPALRGAGQFRVAWHPYKGAVASDTIVLTIAPRKRAELVTDDGTMTLRFFYDEAPVHVANFIELAQAGFYNRKDFHRLEPGYFLQGGCPRGDGTGIRADGKRLPAEFNSQPHQKGTVSMALLDDDPDSASCQFFICNTRQREWDAKYTVFAQLVGDESFATLDRLMTTPVDEFGRPVRTLYIRSVRLIDESAPPYPDAP